MPVHFMAWQEMLNRYPGLQLSEDRFYALGGWPTLAICELLKTETGLAFDPGALAAEKELEFERRIDEVQPIEQVVAVVRESRNRIPIAVATGGTRRVCELILRHIGLFGAFDATVCSEDVQHHKPEPEIFLEAARRLAWRRRIAACMKTPTRASKRPAVPECSGSTSAASTSRAA